MKRDGGLAGTRSALDGLDDVLHLARAIADEISQ